MRYGKRYPKRRPLRRKRAKASNKSVVKIVKRELHRNIENKQITKYQNNLSIQTNNTGSIGNDIYNCIPSVRQGDALNERVGNTLKPLSLRITAQFFPVVQDLSAPQQALYFDMYVFKSKLTNATPPNLQTEIQNFLQPDNSQTITFDGSPQNYFQNSNRSVVTVVAKKRFKIYPLIQNQNQGNLVIDNYSSCCGHITIPMTKHLKSTLKYQNSADSDANNCSLFAFMVATKADSITSVTPAVTYGRVNWTSTMVYEDA